MIIRKQTIHFSGERTPSPASVWVGYATDNLVERLIFVLPIIDSTQTVVMMTTGGYANTILLSKEAEGRYYVDLTADMLGGGGWTEGYVAITGADGTTWNSGVLRMCVGTLPDVSGDLNTRYPNAVEQLLSAVNDVQVAADAVEESITEATSLVQESNDYANQAAESANRAAASEAAAAQVAQNLINDSYVSLQSVWSSRATADRLCPPFEVSGQAVQCHPVEGYPLEVVSQITAVQEGSGEPSPENVRPVSGRTAVSLHRVGKNLIDGTRRAEANTRNGVTIQYLADEDVYLLNGTASGTAVYYMLSQHIATAQGVPLTLSAKYVSGGMTVPDGKTAVYFLGDSDQLGGSSNFLSLPIASDGSTTKVSEKRYISADWFYIGAGVIFDNYKVRLQLEVGSTAAEYAPYCGEAYQAAISPEVYGGSYNWRTGELLTSHRKVELTGTENWVKYGTSGAYTSYSTTLADGVNETGIAAQCSHYPNLTHFGDLYYGRVQACYTGTNNTTPAVLIIGAAYTTVEEFKAYLAAQNAAGTPVTVVYKLAEPTSAGGTGRTVAALEGANTLYSDSGETTVRGRADPIYVMGTLEERIAALEAALVSGI